MNIILAGGTGSRLSTNKVTNKHLLQTIYDSLSHN